MTQPATVRRRIRVEGRVQGVGFRYFVLSVARNLALVGWVRNEADGGVLCEAQGPETAVAAFTEQVRRGPAHARVGKVQIDEVPCLAAAEGSFEIGR